MRSLAVFASSAAGTCVLALALLYVVMFVAAGPAPSPTTVEAQGARGQAPPTSVPTTAPAVVSTPTDVPTLEPTPVPPASDDEGAAT